MDSISRLRDRAQDAWFDVSGDSDWRSLVGPGAFAIVAIGLLVADHLQERVPAAIFWLTLALIVAVAAWMFQTSRRQLGELEQHSRNAMTDRITGLGNRQRLEADVQTAIAGGTGKQVLLLFDLDGLQAYADRYGYSASDELLRRAAHVLVESTDSLGGVPYRVDDSRFALLVPSGTSRLGEIVLTATASLHEEGKEMLIGRSYGEVALPDEAADAESAMQVAGQRLSAHSQSQQRSARRQAHAVLMAVLAARRPELREHLRVVAYRAISLGRRLGLGREEIDDIALASELQDIGLLSVPESILEKETPLTEEEAALIRGRPVAGERIIGAAPGLAPVAILVRASSEFYDGSGFPDGLSGDEIPIGARIIAVAVAFAAMTSSRPYRPAGSSEDALAELRRCAGSQFDPNVVEALAADLSEELAPPPVTAARSSVPPPPAPAAMPPTPAAAP